MAESTPTAYTPNTLSGNLSLSPLNPLRAFVCSFEGQPAERGRGSSGKTQGEQEKTRSGMKGREQRWGAEKTEKKKKERDKKGLNYSTAI